MTQERVVARGLGFTTGDTVATEDLGAALRRLRSYPFLHDDVDFALRFEGDTLRLDVTTRDVWTTRPAFQFRKTGGLLTWMASLEESNLFGPRKGARRLPRRRGATHDLGRVGIWTASS